MSEEGITFHLWPVYVANPNDSDFQSCVNNEADSLRFCRFVVCGLFINLIGLLGLIGNIISMVILSRPQMRSSINYLLIGLARIDTVLIVTSILLFGLPSIYPYSGLFFTYYYMVYPHIAPLVYPLAMVSQTASVYLTVTISLERFVAVCFPLKAKSLCTYGRARIYVIAIVIFSVVYNVPRLFEGTVQQEWAAHLNVTVYCPSISKLRSDAQYIRIYIHWLYLICMYLLPFLALAILNGCIYKQVVNPPPTVLRSNKERQRMSRVQKREIGLATMLLCVVAVFFVCNVLPLVINIIETFDLAFSDKSTINYLIHFSNLLVTINSSVNFIIYVTFGEKFQRLFLALFCHNSLLGLGRDSPEATTNEEVTYVSMADRQSLRRMRQSLSRNGTVNSRNGSLASNNMLTTTGSSRNGSFIGGTRSSGDFLRASSRSRNSSPGPCVYYPVQTAAKNGKDYHRCSNNTFL
nr:unnamed protein product [Callosobruchus chinensis]